MQLTGCNNARISNDHCFAETRKEGEPRLVDKSLERIESGIDGSGVEGGDADEDESPYMTLACSCSAISFWSHREIIKMEFYERKKWSDARRKGKNAEQQGKFCMSGGGKGRV